MTNTPTPTPKRPKRGQLVERDGWRYAIDKVLPDGVIKLHTEGGAFAMFSHVNQWLELNATSCGESAVMKSTLLAQDERAWVAGYMAGNLRRTTACPYPTDSAEAWAWSSGKIEGAAKPHGTLPQLRSIATPQR